VAVEFDNEAVVTGTLAFDTTLTVSGKTTDGENRIAVLHLTATAVPSNVVSAKYGGVDMTLVALLQYPGETMMAGMYYLVDPPEGATDCVVVFNTNPRASGLVSSFKGVDQSDPIGEILTDDLLAEAMSLALTTVEGDMGVDVVHSYNAADIDPTGLGQNALGEVLNNGDMDLEASYRPAAGDTTTMSWESGGFTMHIAAVLNKVAEAAGGDGIPQVVGRLWLNGGALRQSR
jgi:hypothetical protein